MPELDAADRNKLNSNQFAYVDSRGGEHLPIHDESHVRNAISRFDQTDFDNPAAKETARRRILSAAKKYGIEVDADSDVSRVSRSPKTR